MFYVHLKVIFLQRRLCVYLLRTALWRRLYQSSVEMLNTDCSQSCSQHASLWQSCLLARAGRLTPFSLGSSSKDFWLLGWLQSVCPLSVTTLSPTCPTLNRQGHRCCPCFPPYRSPASFSCLFWLGIPHPQLRSSLYSSFWNPPHLKLPIVTDLRVWHNSSCVWRALPPRHQVRDGTKPLSFH